MPAANEPQGDSAAGLKLGEQTKLLRSVRIPDATLSENGKREMTSMLLPRPRPRLVSSLLIPRYVELLRQTRSANHLCH